MREWVGGGGRWTDIICMVHERFAAVAAAAAASVEVETINQAIKQAGQTDKGAYR